MNTEFKQFRLISVVYPEMGVGGRGRVEHHLRAELVRTLYSKLYFTQLSALLIVMCMQALLCMVQYQCAQVHCPLNGVTGFHYQHILHSIEEVPLLVHSTLKLKFLASIVCSLAPT